MAWAPSTGASPVTGYKGTGQTSVRWGSRSSVRSINGVATGAQSGAGTYYGIVTRFNQKPIVENIKLPNGDGLTTTRIQLIDGQQWDITIRDDTNLTGRPAIGNAVVIADGGGFISNTFLFYTATVIESGFDTAPKQPGELTFSVENLVLIENQTGAA